jgi:RNA polymerase sigma-70 factor (ECF subfamily)
MEQTDTERVVRLLTTYQDKLYRYVFALVPNEQDAKDVVQETFVALCRKLDEYDESRPFLPWAYRFAYLEVLKHRQQHRRSAVALSDDVVETLARERAERNEFLDARLQALEHCLEQLPPADFELIRGRYHSRLSIDKLAAKVGMSHRTLFRNLDRVRRVLLACITRRLAGDGLV